MYVIIQIVVIEIGGSTKSARGWGGGGGVSTVRVIGLTNL